MTDDDIKEMIPYLDSQARIALIEDRLGKFSDGDLAKLVEVTRKCLFNRRKELGITAFTLPGYMKKLDRRKIKTMLAKGMSDEAIAVKLNCSANHIGNIRRTEFEVWVNGPQEQPYRKHDWDQIEKLSKTMGASEIAERLNISVHTIHSVLKRIKQKKEKNAKQN